MPRKYTTCPKSGAHWSVCLCADCQAMRRGDPERTSPPTGSARCAAWRDGENNCQCEWCRAIRSGVAMGLSAEEHSEAASCDCQTCREVRAELAAKEQAKSKKNTKPSNPKDALGILKICFSVIPTPVLWELGLAMLEGALKYGRHNYRVIGVRASVYYDAVVARHLGSWWEGEDIDPDSDVSHVTKAIASLVVLRDAMIRGNWVDDRPPKTEPEVLKRVNDHVKMLLEKYPVPVAPYTELGEQQKRGNPSEP